VADGFDVVAVGVEVEGAVIVGVIVGARSPPAAPRRDQGRAGQIRRVLFVELFGRVTPTEARRITLEESTRFAAVHADVYRRFGYDCVSVAPGDVEARFEAVRAQLARTV